MHSSTMGKTAMATSGLLHKDETQGEEARTYLRSSFLCVHTTIINLVFTDEAARVALVWLKSIKVDGRSARDQLDPLSSWPFWTSARFYRTSSSMNARASAAILPTCLKQETQGSGQTQTDGSK